MYRNKERTFYVFTTVLVVPSFQYLPWCTFSFINLRSSTFMTVQEVVGGEVTTIILNVLKDCNISGV